MKIYKIIEQITEQLTEKVLLDERVQFLVPIDFIIDPPDLKKAKETHEIFCIIPLERFKKTDSLEVNHVIIRDEYLFKKLHSEIKDNNVFIKYLNRELFKYIQTQFLELKNLGIMNNDNIWYKANRRFANWFSLKKIDPFSKNFEKENTDDALLVIANDMIDRKEKGEFSTYMEAYRWATKHLSKSDIMITPQKLKAAYQKAKSKGKIGITKKVSIPIMITNKMRMELSTLGYSKEEMRNLTPIQAHKIIQKGVPKKPSRDRNRNQ